MTQGPQERPILGIYLCDQALMFFLASSITFAGGQGRDGIIDFTSGSELLITKAKNGHLAVVSGTCWPGSKVEPLRIKPSFEYVSVPFPLLPAHEGWRGASWAPMVAIKEL